MHPSKAPDRVEKTILVDIIRPLPMSKDYNVILIVVNQLSKIVHVIPTNTTVMAEQIVHLY